MSRSLRLKDCVRYSLFAASIAAVGATAPSIAAAADAEESKATLGEVVVTAQKREESLTEIAVAISAFTSEQRDQLGISSVVDMANFTPGFVYNTGQDRVSMRGIGRYTNQLGADSSVGVYEDGVFETFTVKAGNSSLYTDRIEILRGPQGTLYGRASIGGAVNIISRRPTDALYAEARLTYDNYQNRVIEGAISGPLTDTLKYRLVATKYDQTEGYFNNVGGGPDSGNVRDEWVYEAQLQWNPSDKDQLWLKLFGGQWDNGGGNAGGRTTNQVIVGLDGNTPTATGVYPVNLILGSTTLGYQLTTNALIPSLGIGFTAPTRSSLNPNGVNPGNRNIRDFYSNYPQNVTLDDYYGMVLEYTHDFSSFAFKYTGGLQHYNYFENVEWGEGYVLATGLDSYQFAGQAVVFPNSLLYYNEKHTLNSNEFNLISTTDSALQWVAGVYNFNQQYSQPESVYRPGQAQLATPVNGPANPHRDIFYGEGDGGSRAWALYGQLDWGFTETWKATLGARYEQDWKWGNDIGSLHLFIPTGAGTPLNLTNVPGVIAAIGTPYPGATAAVYNPTTGRAERRLDGDWTGVTGTAGFQWTPDKDTNLYFKYSRGFKSGGFNIGAGVVPNPRTDSESSNDYQLGFKRSVGGSFQMNIDVFYDQYYNAQIPIGSLQASGLIATSFFNIPESRSSGVEVELAWQATDALNFMFNYGYNKTEIIESGCLVDAAGDPGAVLIGNQRGSCPAGSQNIAGNQLPNAPENKFALNGNYTFGLGDGTLMLSASYIWRDEQFGSVFNRPYTNAPSWDQTDLRVTYKTGEHLTLIAFGKNVFDDVGYSGGALAARQNDGTGAAVGWVKNYQLVPPAIYGMELQYKF
jgi:iron complex outermembrane receptor protein